MPERLDPTLVFATAATTGAAAGFAARALLPALDRLTDQFTADLTPQLRAVHADTSAVRRYLRVWAVVLAAVPAGLLVFAGLGGVAAVVAGLLFLAPRAIVRGVVRRQRVKLRDQIVSGCTNLANTARAGLSLLQGLENVTADTPEPLAFEFRRVVNEARRGRPLVDAIGDTQDRVRMESFTLFASAVRACYRQGGDMTAALERISTSLIENQRLERKLEAETAAGQKAVRVLAVCPLAFLVLFAVMDPEALQTYATAPGQVVLAVVLTLDFLAVRWARSILKLDRAAK